MGNWLWPKKLLNACSGLGATFGCLALVHGVTLRNHGRNPRSHTAFRHLAALGPVEVSLPKVEKEIRENGKVLRLRSLITTPSFAMDFSDLSVYELRNLVWIYRRDTTTQHLLNFMPTTKTEKSAIVLVFSNEIVIIEGPPDDVDTTIQQLIPSCPWAIVGYTHKLAELWNSSRAEFIATVQARRNS